MRSTVTGASDRTAVLRIPERFFSVQVARLLAQAAAIATIWQFLAETGGSPLENSGVSQTP
ncbi:DUF6185 family protein [Streptomyces sp. NPDC012403]|uniref:DUF6185 family protein n=1 Tax=unclassified Streptomyces TaxID=2593676 RepID=UPI0034541FAF